MTSRENKQTGEGAAFHQDLRLAAVSERSSDRTVAHLLISGTL
jgi:hypothetical protein